MEPRLILFFAMCTHIAKLNFSNIRIMHPWIVYDSRVSLGRHYIELDSFQRVNGKNYITIITIRRGKYLFPQRGDLFDSKLYYMCRDPFLAIHIMNNAKFTIPCECRRSLLYDVHLYGTKLYPEYRCRRMIGFRIVI